MTLTHQWYGLADEALEDAVYDSQAMRASRLGINLAADPVLEATTLLKFHRRLEKENLCAALFETIINSSQILFGLPNLLLAS